MKSIFSYLAVAAVALLCAGTLSAQTSKTKAPVRQGWRSSIEITTIAGVPLTIECDPLYGDVESIEEFCYESSSIAEDGSILSDAMPSSRNVYRFNDRGDVVDMIECYGSNIDKSIVYEYNNLGLLISKIEYNPEYTECGCVVNTYKYNAKSQLVSNTEQYIKSDDETSLSETIYEYDDAGNLVISKKISDDFFSLIAYTYDSANRLTEECEYDSEDCLYPFTSTHYTYDKMGRVTVCNEVAITSPACYNLMYTYDAHGRLDAIVDSSIDSQERMVYNSAGMLCGYKVVCPDGTCSSKRVYTIDDNGLVTELELIENQALRICYSHDSRGNIVKICVSNMYVDNSDHICTYIRNITYRK